MADQHLIPKDYVKPDVRVGNYFLKWSPLSYGIPQKEMSILRRFIADLAPFMSTFIFEASHGIQRTIRENASSKEARNFEEAFSPRLMITRRTRNSEYVLQMAADGAATIGRSETIIRDGKQARLALTWDLGQLLFDRQQY